VVADPKRGDLEFYPKDHCGTTKLEKSYYDNKVNHCLHGKTNKECSYYSKINSSRAWEGYTP
jgi:hypothetical protein